MSKIKKSNLQKAAEIFLEEWPYFYRCINFDDSALDARAIRFLNEVPGKISTGLNESFKEMLK